SSGVSKTSDWHFLSVLKNTKFFVNSISKSDTVAECAVIARDDDIKGPISRNNNDGSGAVQVRHDHRRCRTATAADQPHARHHRCDHLLQGHDDPGQTTQDPLWQDAAQEPGPFNWALLISNTLSTHR